MEFMRIDNLSIGIGQFKLQNIDLGIPRGEVLVVLGSSGSGKSVLLESIAGFNRPLQGQIWLDGRDITGEFPEKRRIGFMFQDYALFPHLTVWENIIFSRQFRRTKIQDKPAKALIEYIHPNIRHRFRPAFRFFGGLNLRQETIQDNLISNLEIDPGEIAGMLRINHLLSRYPTQLSGGEKQRVAMARVLVQQPKLFLLDEPMSALDARTREDLREELGGIFKRLGLTVIYVTHDQTEALALADRVCILNAGKIEQFGAKEEVFNQPANSLVAKFVGMENVFPGVVVSFREIGGIWEYCVQVKVWGLLNIHSEPVFSCFKPGEIVNVGIRPENILIQNPVAANQDPKDNHLVAMIRNIVPWGVVYKLHLGEKIGLTAMVTKHQLQSLNLKPNDVLQVILPPGNLHIMPSGIQ